MAYLCGLMRKFFRQLLLWRIRHISNRNFILLAAAFVGVCGGLAAVLMKTTVHYVEQFLTQGKYAMYHNYLFFIFPLIGIVLTVLYKTYILKKYEINGLGNLLHTISRKSSNVERHEIYSNIAGSSLTVGFGGSVGLETPIVTTGAAIGSNIGRWANMSYKKRTLLIACGVAAGIGGIFNAPIAGIIFTIEVLLLEFTVPAFVPILIAAVAGTLVSNVLTGEQILFTVGSTDDFNLHDIPFYILLGIFTGLTSAYFLKVMNFARRKVLSIANHNQRAVIGGIALGALIFLFPVLYGEGYLGVQKLLGDRPEEILEGVSFFSNQGVMISLLILVLAVMLLKVIAAALTIGAGGNGGIFAPSLVTGAFCGFFLSYGINALNIFKFDLSVKNFTIIGMAGLISGVLHAPLTSLFLIAELSGGYSLILPIMLVSAIAFATARYIEPHSIYLRQLAQLGHVYTHDRDKTILTHMQMGHLIERDLEQLNKDATLRDIVDAVSRSSRSVFPVLDQSGKLCGIIHLDDIRHIMFKPELYDKVKVSQIMHAPQTVMSSSSMEDVMEKFDRSGEWNLAVVDEDNRYLGMLSKSKIFSQYRSVLKKQAKEDFEIIE